ncbi:uncharacterized protein [Rutidosis leptorrhynchoides]|uniref:uncharacterized protein n=1 Tax=Rutidosis leptorrhynchoides TaxID=125765 RepID=UPI003A98F407
MALIGKWWWRFLTETSSLWVKVIKSIYAVSGLLDSGGVFNHTYHSTWSIIVKTGVHLEELGFGFTKSFKKEIDNGKDTSFWLDTWFEDTPLKDRFRRLFRLERDPNVSVHNRLGWDGTSNLGSWEWVNL